jgi:hypothetical protein
VAIRREGHVDLALLHAPDQAGALDVENLHPHPRRHVTQLAEQVADDDALGMVGGGDGERALQLGQRDQGRRPQRV